MTNKSNNIFRVYYFTVFAIFLRYVIRDLWIKSFALGLEFDLEYQCTSLFVSYGLACQIKFLRVLRYGLDLESSRSRSHVWLIMLVGRPTCMSKYLRHSGPRECRSILVAWQPIVELKLYGCDRLVPSSSVNWQDGH